MHDISWRNLTPNEFQSFGCTGLFAKSVSFQSRRCEDEFRCWQISRQMRRFFESSLLFFLPRFTLDLHRTCCERHLKNLVGKLAWLRTMRTQKMTYPSPHFAPIMVEWKDNRIRKVTIVFRYIGVHPLFPHLPLNHDCWWGKSSHCGATGWAATSSGGPGCITKRALERGLTFGTYCT